MLAVPGIWVFQIAADLIIVLPAPEPKLLGQVIKLHKTIKPAGDLEGCRCNQRFS
jgi:hypothetical protein